MKNLLLAALLACGVTATAQDYKKYSFGVTAAVNFSTLHKDVEEPGYRIAPAAEVFMEARLFGTTYLHTALGYTMLGGTYQPKDDNNVLPYTERDVKVNYLILPVTYRMYTEKHFFVEIGPQFSLLLSNDIQETVVEDGATVNQASGLKVRPFDIGAVLGIGWRFSNQWTVQAGLRGNSYNLFLNDGPAKVQRSGAQLAVSYYF